MDTARPTSPAAQIDRKPKKLELSAPSSRKVCIICFCAVIGNADYYIFIIDLASEGDDKFNTRAPTLRLDYKSFAFHAYCVLDSTLYIFEACPDMDDNLDRKSVFMLDLSTIDALNTFDLRLEKTDLNPAPAMHFPKRYPLATPTPDGKRILVFSSELNFTCMDEEHETPHFHEIDFELYVPSDGLWIQLPGIPHDWGDSFPVQSFTFVNKSIFLLQTRIGRFALDLELLDDGWKRLDSYVGAGCNSFIGGRFFVTEDGLSLTPWGAYDIPDQKGGVSRFFRFPRSRFGDDYYELSLQHPMTLLHDVDNGKCNFCIMQTALSRLDDFPHLIADVCSCDLIKYREDKQTTKETAQIEARIEASITKSFKFLLAFQRCIRLRPVNLFYLGGGTN